LVAVLAKGAARRPAPDTVHSTCCLMCARTAVRRNIDRRMCVGGGMSLVTLSTVVSRPFGMVSSRVFWNGRHIPSDRHVRSARERVGHDSKYVSIISASTGFCDYCIHGQTCRGAQNSSHICMSRPLRSILDRDALSTPGPDALRRALSVEYGPRRSRHADVATVLSAPSRLVTDNVATEAGVCRKFGYLNRIASFALSAPTACRSDKM
jgi:hypothetical protein